MIIFFTSRSFDFRKIAVSTIFISQLKLHHNQFILVNGHLVVLTVNVEKLMGKLFALVFHRTSVIRQIADQNVSLAPNAQITNLVSIKNVWIHVLELAERIHSVLSNYTVQYVRVNKGSLGIHLRDATEFLHVSKFLFFVIFVWLYFSIN